MTFIETIPDAEATGAVAAMYAADRRPSGAVPNYTRAFSHRPALYAVWRELNAAVKAQMDPRRYELATLAAALELRSSYCSLAHGGVLAGLLGGDEEAVRAIAADPDTAALDETDRAVMELAALAARDATAVSEADIARLRDLGLRDEEIFDVITAATARCFFSKTLDALGVRPDASYADLDPSLREALVVGRPIAAG